MSPEQQSCIRKYCFDLYEQLLDSIETCRDKGADSPACIECCFNAAEITRLQLEKFISGHQFKNTDEEVWFFKKMKPQFVALVEFFILIYRSIMFCPDDNTGMLQYWQQELENLKKFFREHAAFYLYIKNGARVQDQAFFLRSTGKEYHFKGMIESEPGTYSSRDSLVAACLARERYFNFVAGKLSELRGAYKKI